MHSILASRSMGPGRGCTEWLLRRTIPTSFRPCTGRGRIGRKKNKKKQGALKSTWRVKCLVEFHVKRLDTHDLMRLRDTRDREVWVVWCGRVRIWMSSIETRSGAHRDIMSDSRFGLWETEPLRFLIIPVLLCYI